LQVTFEKTIKMKYSKKIIYGLLITIIIFFLSNFLVKKFHLNIEFIPNSFIIHSIMFVLSILFISIFRKNINFSISFPKFKEILKPIALGILVSIIVNISMSIVTKISGGNIEGHSLIFKMTPFQVFIFIFIYASIAEEMLFRGFLLNMLEPLKSKGVTLLNRKISLSVIISAIMFGFSHLILITIGMGWPFLIRVVLFATILGLISGYYQEKHNNTAFAIIVHMAGNSLAVIGAILMNMVVT